MRFGMALCVMGCLVGSVPSAHAAIDMTGTWTFSGSGVFGNATYSVQQVGTLVTICNGIGSLHGTIDPATGALTWDFLPARPIETPEGYACNPAAPDVGIQWTGTVSPDGGSLTANERYGTICIPPPFTCNGQIGQCMDVADHPIAATRISTSVVTSCGCGNGILDPGEACDPGLPSTCCALDCSAAQNGATCADDSNPCTDDICNDAGACTHPANSAPCGSTCQSGTCFDGSCQLGAPAPAGTACNADENVCPVDTCDGAGQCVAAYGCGPCTVCDPSLGCSPLVVASCLPMAHGRLDLVRGATASRDHVRWGFTAAASVGSFGNPATTTSYTLCVFDSPGPGVTSLLFEATAPAASTCGSRPCWSTQTSSIRYRDPLGASDGIRNVRGNGAPAGSFSVNGRGAALGLPSLNVGDTLSAALVAHDGASFQACWGGTFMSPSVDTSTRYHAKR